MITIFIIVALLMLLTLIFMMVVMCNRLRALDSKVSKLTNTDAIELQAKIDELKAKIDEYKVHNKALNLKVAEFSKNPFKAQKV